MEPPPKAGGAFPQGFVGFRVPFWGSYRGRYMGGNGNENGNYYNEPYRI